MNKRLWMVFGVLFASVSAYAGDDIGSIEAVAGIPQLLGGGVQYFLTNNIHLGAGYGFIPVDGTLQKKVSLGSYDLGSGAMLTPTAAYGLTSLSFFVRFFPSPDKDGGGFFVQALYSHWDATASMSGSLDLAGTTIDGLLQGKMTLSQNNYGLMVGHEYVSSSSVKFFFDIAGGLAIKSKVTVATNIDPNLSQISGILGASQQTQLNQSINQIQGKVTSSLDSYNGIPVIPIASIAIGVRF